ncbi:MAG: GNAT family N-acetyltransferase [Candidatus Eremiobacteraeota bacterium]|nr:GNAT family N-acetyltransferase [Candidatus Eremiobacteraeota bacterium]
MRGASGVIEIRAGAVADRTFAAELGKRTMLDSVAAFRYVSPPMLDASYERLLEIVFSQSHVFLVAESAGERAGFLLMLDTLPDEVTRMPQGFIAYMAVEPELRGCGVGKRLLETAEEEARRRGLPYVALMVTEENRAARAMYERAGYVTERRLLCKVL